MRSTGPVVVMAGITAFNAIIVHDRPTFDLYRIAISGGIVAGGLALVETVWESGAVAMAYLGLVTILLVRIDPKVPAPLESVADWLQK